MKWAVLSFDLEGAMPEDYGKAHAILDAFGFTAMTPVKAIMLPNTVFMMEVADAFPAESIRNIVELAFRRMGLRPSRIFGGILDDWATVGPVAHP